MQIPLQSIQIPRLGNRPLTQHRDDLRGDRPRVLRSSDRCDLGFAIDRDPISDGGVDQ